MMLDLAAHVLEVIGLTMLVQVATVQTSFLVLLGTIWPSSEADRLLHVPWQRPLLPVLPPSSADHVSSCLQAHPLAKLHREGQPHIHQ